MVIKKKKSKNIGRYKDATIQQATFTGAGIKLIYFQFGFWLFIINYKINSKSLLFFQFTITSSWDVIISANRY